MATLAKKTVHIDSKQRFNKVVSCSNTVNHSNIANKETRFSDSKANDLRFELANNLQCSLELETILTIFLQHISLMMECNGLRFTEEKGASKILIGTESTHTVSYKVSSSDKLLGELCFLRTNKFSETELAILEMYIGILFYPLRNALQYKAALESSFTDSLTGVGNRSSLEFNAAREIKLALRHKKAMTMLLIDVDHFKQVNDTYGHLNGDKALQEIVNIITQSLRETDQIFRFGGEEFVAILNESDMHNAKLSAERIRKRVESHIIETENTRFNTSVSIGVAALCSGDNFDSLFARADEALYNAKKGGRNRVMSSMSNDDSEIQRSA